MGRRCCSSSCYKPSYNPYCCPPLPYGQCFNPCFPPCGPCIDPCNPCFQFNNCYDYEECCETPKKTDFLGNSTDTVNLVPTPSSTTAQSVTLTFTEVRDCNCSYNNNQTFNPKCKGSYKINASVPVSLTTNTTATASVKLNLVVNGSVVASSTLYTTTAAAGNYTTTLSISQSVCLRACDNVYIQTEATRGSPSDAITTSPETLRSFSGCTNTNSCCKYQSKCCKKSCC